MCTMRNNFWLIHKVHYKFNLVVVFRVAPPPVKPFCEAPPSTASCRLAWENLSALSEDVGQNRLAQ